MISPLCDQTVTVYHLCDGTVQRQVIAGCFYRWKEQQVQDGTLQRSFQLILPPGYDVFVGDRIYDGVGPLEVEWQQFLPINTPGLCQVAYVTAYRLNGHPHHTEAGRT